LTRYRTIAIITHRNFPLTIISGLFRRDILQQKNLLSRIIDSISETLGEWATIVSTREFWGLLAVGATVVGFLAVAGSMLINFDSMRMRNCFNASDLNAYLMFNILMFFVFAGVMALGEAFNYFDNKKRGEPHKLGSTFSLIIITTALGSIGLVMLKISC
jgi:hypothetical protein